MFNLRDPHDLKELLLLVFGTVFGGQILQGLWDETVTGLALNCDQGIEQFPFAEGIPLIYALNCYQNQGSDLVAPETTSHPSRLPPWSRLTREHFFTFGLLVIDHVIQDIFKFDPRSWRRPS